MEHHFNPEIAQEYGIEEAVMLHKFFFWSVKSANNEEHFYDGLYWHYNSIRALTESFPYMTESKIFRVIKHLTEEGLVVKGNYNTDKWIKTNWYALTLKGIAYMYEKGYKNADFSRLLQNEGIDTCKMKNRYEQNEESYIENNIINNNNKNYVTDKEDNNILLLSKKKTNFQAIIACWNENNGEKLGRVTKLTEKRKRQIAKVLEDHNIDGDTLMLFFKTLPFCDKWLYNPDSSHRNWKPDFDWWLANPKGWLTKGLEGKVHKENPHVFESIMAGKNGEQVYTPHGYGIGEDGNGGYVSNQMFDGVVYDGYTDDNRPDGATLKLNSGRGTIRWFAEHKKWRKV